MHISIEQVKLVRCQLMQSTLKIYTINLKKINTDYPFCTYFLLFSKHVLDLPLMLQK